MQIKRIAVISGNADRVSAIGLACRDALGRVVEVEHYRLADLQSVPRRGFDLYLYVDDEFRQTWPQDLRPAACWLIDGRGSIAQCAAAAIDFDHVFAARRSAARLLGERGIHAHWLPPACGPNVWNAQDHQRLMDICLIGDATAEHFKATAELLGKRFVGHRVLVENGEEPRRDYSDCRIVAVAGASGLIGCEPIQAIAGGAALLIEQSEAADLLGSLRDGVHFVSYCGPHELLAQISFYLKRQDLWHRMSRAGRMHATTHGNYFARMEQLLAECAKSWRAPKSPGMKAVGSRSVAEQLLEIIPKTAARVLDLDPDGSLAETFQARQPTHSFDCILLRDRLERIENPSQLLRHVRQLLAPGGCAIAQVSNVGHYRRVASLLNGDWTYGAGGAVPAGAINLFTRRSAERLFAATEWNVRQVLALPDPQSDAGPHGPHMTALKECGVFDTGSPCDPQAEGYLLRAEPVAQSVEPPTIIVVSLNRSPDLRGFVRSLLHATDENAFELLFIDTGWDEAARALLSSLKIMLPLRIAELPVTTSFVDAISEGIRQCRSSNVVLLSPNIRFTPGWLRRLVATLESDRNVGLVAPRIMIGADEDTIGISADHAAAQLAGSSTVADEVSCACLLVRRDRTADIEWILPKTDDGTLAVARLSTAAIKGGQKALIAQDACVWSIPPGGNAGDEWPRLLVATGQAFPNIVHVENGKSTSSQSGRRILDLRDPPAGRDLESFLSRELIAAQTNSGFDCILIDELLSYVPDAMKTLTSLRDCLAAAGVVKARFRNVCHRRSIGDLIEGRSLSLSTAGELPPLRFFTRREIEKLFYRAGFTIRSIEAETESDGYGGDKDIEHDETEPITCGPLRVSGIGPDEAERFRAVGYAVEAAPSPGRNYAKTSILVIGGSQVEITRRCIESVRQRTDEPYQLLILAGSDLDGTKLPHFHDVTIISPLAGESRSATYERAIEHCTGRHIVLMNDHITATTGWLRRMLRALDSDKSIALVGPCSSAGIGAQVGPQGQELSLLDGLAWEWASAHDGSIEDAPDLQPSCLLLFVETLKQLGKPQPRHIPARLVETGRRVVVARDSYVHCSGPPDLTVEAPQPTEPATIPMAWRADPAGPDLVLVRDRPPISLCMIVRDSARTLGRCLGSIRPWVSEMIVVDTGSVDGTPELARRLGARVYHFPWCCDFAAARNESIRHARGQWIFWMDADDTIDGMNGRRLTALVLEPARPSLLGYVMQVHCPGGGHPVDVTLVDHVKLFRNRPDLRFQGRIHEQILPAIRRAGGDVDWTEVHVTHSGADYSAVGRRRKFARDVRLLELEFRDRPNHSFTLFNLGMTHADIGEHSTAVDYLRRSLEKSEVGESHVRKIHALLAASLAHLQRNKDAYQTCLAGLKSFPLDAELNFRAAIAAHRLGDFSESERLYIKVIAGGDARHFSSVDRGIAGFKAHYNLGGVYRDMGRIADAEAQYAMVTQAAPSWAEGWRALVDVRIEAQRYSQVEQDLRRMSEVPSLAAEAAHLERRLESARLAKTAMARA